MTRLTVVVVCFAFILALAAGRSEAQVQWAGGKQPEPGPVLNCDDDNQGRCADLWDHVNEYGEYIGHDEPSLLFYSHRPGAGNSSIYKVVLPRESLLQPTQDGRGGTFNFQLHPAFWFGMDLCDTQSAPNFTEVCNPDTDDNIFDNPDPNAPDYIGHHPGGAFLELQFYPPGWVGSPQLIDSTQYFAAAAIFSFGTSQVTGQRNNLDCRRKVGTESANFAVITNNGVPLFPPNPLGLPFGNFKPDLSNVLVMNPGDTLLVAILDTPDGLLLFIKDLTTGDSGSMVASVANGFGQVMFQPDPDPAHPSVTCSVQPYAFHPMYSTASEHTRLTWTAHSYNVAFSDEIGHFEYCTQASNNPPFLCTIPGPNDTAGLDVDDRPCFGPSQPFFPPPPFIQITGCRGSDVDFDGVPYNLNWAGTFTNPILDFIFHPRPIRFTSPVFIGEDGLQNYSRVAFEADFPAIESTCNVLTGAGCTNPPQGANFYPIYTTRRGRDHDEDSDDICTWQFGGRHIPGTTNDFGGSPATEYGGLLQLAFPVPGGTVSVFEDNRRVLRHNPCRVDLDDLVREHMPR
jgi:hypothetical protein